MNSEIPPIWFHIALAVSQLVCSFVGLATAVTSAAHHWHQSNFTSFVQKEEALVAVVLITLVFLTLMVLRIALRFTLDMHNSWANGRPSFVFDVEQGLVL